jgi:hypothetical protein
MYVALMIKDRRLGSKSYRFPHRYTIAYVKYLDFPKKKSLIEMAHLFRIRL